MSGLPYVRSRGVTSWLACPHLLTSGIFPPDQVACIVPEICQEVCSNPTGCSNIAYPKLVLEILPTGNIPAPEQSPGKWGAG